MIRMDFAIKMIFFCSSRNQYLNWNGIVIWNPSLETSINFDFGNDASELYLFSTFVLLVYLNIWRPKLVDVKQLNKLL